MARYRGPRTKKSRRYGVALFGPSKAFERKNYPPGVHGDKGRRRKEGYGEALAEKQKFKLYYGLLEKQFRRYYEIARRRRGVTGENLLQLLETRIDNIVYRFGFANSHRSARQMVVHGHVQVNGRKVTAGNYHAKPGDVVQIKDTSISRRLAATGLEAMQIAPVPDWLALEKEEFKGQIKRMPAREEINPIGNEQLVVELYSR